MHEIEASIDIEAPPATVWQVFSDYAAYPDWNPFVRSIEGAVRVGERLRVRLEPPSGRGMTMRPTVLAYTPEQELRWLGRLGLPHVFDGEHQFTLESINGGLGTRFVQHEKFQGVLVPLLGSVLRKTEAAFRAMNDALRDRAEAAIRAPH
jgi:hypothetical protein